MTKPRKMPTTTNRPPFTDDLISSIRTTVLIHHEMFLRVMAQSDRPSEELIELLEDTGNTYIDYSEALAKNLRPFRD